MTQTCENTGMAALKKITRRGTERAWFRANRFTDGQIGLLAMLDGIRGPRVEIWTMVGGITVEGRDVDEFLHIVNMRRRWAKQVLELKHGGAAAGTPDPNWVSGRIEQAVKEAASGTLPSKVIINLDHDLLVAGYDVVLVRIDDVYAWQEHPCAQVFARLCWNGYEEVD